MDTEEFAAEAQDTVVEVELVADLSDSAETSANHAAAPSGFVLSVLPVTGEPRVDDALARLMDLADLPVAEHVDVIGDVQRRLHDTLADLAES